MHKHIYLVGELVQTAPMATGVQTAWQSHAGAGDGGSLLGKLLLCELALSATFLASPAHGQSMSRLNLTGRVEARCSAVRPAGFADMRGDEGLTRALTIRCSGPNPALTVRARAYDDPDVAVTVASAVGQDGRMSTIDGNVLVDLARLRSADGTLVRNRGPVEIVVSPAS